MAVIQIPDINGQPNQVCFQSPATPVDGSGTANGQSQMILAAVPTGTVRSGWIVQNNSTQNYSMFVNDLGSPADTSPTSVVLLPGQFWPPPGYPVTQGAVYIMGTSGDNYMVRSW